MPVERHDGRNKNGNSPMQTATAKCRKRSSNSPDANCQCKGTLKKTRPSCPVGRDSDHLHEQGFVSAKTNEFGLGSLQFSFGLFELGLCRIPVTGTKPRLFVVVYVDNFKCRYFKNSGVWEDFTYIGTLGSLPADGKTSHLWEEFPCIGKLPMYGKTSRTWEVFPYMVSLPTH